MTLDAQQRNPPTHACSLLSLIAVLMNDTEMCAPERFLAGRCLDLTPGVWKPKIRQTRRRSDGSCPTKKCAHVWTIYDLVWMIKSADRVRMGAGVAQLEYRKCGTPCTCGWSTAGGISFLRRLDL